MQEKGKSLRKRKGMCKRDNGEWIEQRMVKKIKREMRKKESEVIERGQKEKEKRKKKRKKINENESRERKQTNRIINRKFK